jgi:CSLREA domain-containing protein
MRFGRRTVGVAVMVLIATSFGVAIAPPASAAIITVNTLGDAAGVCPATCTLRAAIDAANASAGADEIMFSVNGTITLAGAAELVVNDATNGALTITGNGATNTIVDGVDASRVINVTGNDPLTLTRLTIRNGTPGDTEAGGGVQDIAGTVTTVDVDFTDNDAVLNGGGAVNANSVSITRGTFHGNQGFAGGAIQTNTGTITSATFTANTATNNRGGAVLFNNSLTVNDSTFGGPDPADGNDGNVAGGALATISAATLNVTGSTFQNNTGGSSGGGGAIYSSGTSMTATITTSTFTSNTGTQVGGAISIDDQASLNPRTLTVTQSTFEGNKTTSGFGLGGAIWVEGDTHPASATITNNTFDTNDAFVSGGAVAVVGAAVSATLRNNTFTSNDATTGSVAHNNGASVTLAANIISQNVNTSCSGTMTDGGHNLVFADAGGSTCPTTGTNLTGQDPLLDPLALNAPGVTETRALQSNSPAIDAIDSGSCPPPSIDQRGVPRPLFAGCDIGAFESSPGSFTPLPPVRILDTRNNIGLSGAFAPGQERDLDVTDTLSSGVPATGVDAVLLNVTATSATKSGWLTLYPDGATVPTASNLNFVAGQTVPNLVLVKTDDGGGTGTDITIANTKHPTIPTPNAGSVHVIADVVGYYDDAEGDNLVAITPERIADTRNNIGDVGSTPVPPGGEILVDPTTSANLPAAGSYTAVVVNVTATGGTKNGWLTVFPSDGVLPTASNINFLAGQTIPNLVKILVSAEGQFRIANTKHPTVPTPNAGTVHIIVDIVGYFA